MNSIVRLTSCILLTGLAAINAAQAAELYHNDRTKDSGPAIVEHIRAAKLLPVGVFYAHTMMDAGSGVGGALLGSGAPDFAKPYSAWSAPWVAVTQIIDARPRDNAEPLLRIRRSRFRVADIGLAGCIVWPGQHNTAMSAGPIVEITQRGAEWPVGMTSFDRVTVTNGEIGILHADNGDGGGHCDHTRTRELVTHTVDYSIITDDNQSVDHRFDLYAAGNGKAVIWAKQGGKIVADIRTNGSWDRWLLLGDAEKKTYPNKNNGFFRLRVDMDGGDAVGSPLEELCAYEWSRPVVHIRGIASDTAEIKGDPILLNKARVRINIERSLKANYVWEAN